MKDNLSIVITVILLVILMVIFPLYNFFERQDDMSYNLVLKATTNFADEVMNNGYIDQDSYDRFVTELATTGNVYDIQIEAHRKILIKSEDNANEYVEQSYIDYNDDIFNKLEDTATANTNLMGKTLKNNIYYLNAKDEIYVKVKNDNTTMAGALFNAIIPVSNKTRIAVNYGGIVKNTAWKQVDATYTGQILNPDALEINIGNRIYHDGEELEITYSKFKEVEKLFISNTENSGITEYHWEIQKPDGSKEIPVITTSELPRAYFMSSEGLYKITVYGVTSNSVKTEPTTVKIKIRGESPVIKTNLFEGEHNAYIDSWPLHKLRNYNLYFYTDVNKIQKTTSKTIKSYHWVFENSSGKKIEITKSLSSDMIYMNRDLTNFFEVPSEHKITVYVEFEDGTFSEKTVIIIKITQY